MSNLTSPIAQAEAEGLKPIAGKDKILMFRLVKERPYKSAAVLSLQTTHTLKMEAKSESTPTKDGIIVGAGEVEFSIELEALLSDTTVAKMLEYCVQTGSTLEVWEINLAKQLADNKFEARYGTGVLEGWELPAEVGKNATVKTTMKLNGQFLLMPAGATLDRDNQDAVVNLVYDTVKASAGEVGQYAYEPVTAEEDKDLTAKKKEATIAVNALDKLTSDEKLAFVKRINEAKPIAAVDAILVEAQEANTAKK